LVEEWGETREGAEARDRSAETLLCRLVVAHDGGGEEGVGRLLDHVEHHVDSIVGPGLEQSEGVLGDLQGTKLCSLGFVEAGAFELSIRPVVEWAATRLVWALLSRGGREVRCPGRAVGRRSSGTA